MSGSPRTGYCRGWSLLMAISMIPPHIFDLEDYQLYSVSDLMEKTLLQTSPSADDDLLIELLLLAGDMPTPTDVSGSVGAQPSDPAWFGYRWKAVVDGGLHAEHAYDLVAS